MTSIQRVKTRKKKTPREKARLMALIAEATVDAYNESEQRMGFHTMLEEHLDMPFDTSILGVNVVVERVDLADDDQIVAICRRGRTRQAVPILNLPLPTPHPAGAEWIDAYRLWTRPG
jgi:hypothetical protein